MGGGGRVTRGAQSGSPAGVEEVRESSGPANQSSRSPHNPEKDDRAPIAEDFVPGSYVRHAKYGRGLVLRREGTGPATKLTVSFPGYGQKKLVEKYAGLQKDVG